MAIEASKKERGERRIRYGMIGGGEGAFIGAVHRLVARIDDHFEFVAGALSSTPEKARRSGRALGLEPARCYPDYATMLAAEAKREDGIEAVAIVTPNHVHAAPAEACLAAGLHVICDKPLAATLPEGLRLQKAAARHGVVFGITYNYTGYPMIREARARIAAGGLGRIRVVNVEYIQDWLTTALERAGQKQALWRTDPKQAGAGGCIGDIGTHAFQLLEFVTGLEVEAVAADLQRFVPRRRLDDNAHIQLRLARGARGTLWASQVAVGNENGLRLRVYGDKGGMSWHQEHPNQLLWTPFGEPTRILSRGGAGTGAAAARVTRIPAGHPEGYLEAFASVYTEIAAAIRARRAGKRPPREVVFPGLVDGVRGLRFVDAAVRSSARGGRWTKLG